MEFINDGLVTKISRHSVRDLIDHLCEIIQAKGLSVFARIDHAANAAAAGKVLRPTELLIFGDPGIAADLMRDRQEIGLDLPLKALAWEDENGEIWLTYDDGRWLARRHGLSPMAAANVGHIETVMSTLAREATET